MFDTIHAGGHYQLLNLYVFLTQANVIIVGEKRILPPLFILHE